MPNIISAIFVTLFSLNTCSVYANQSSLSLIEIKSFESCTFNVVAEKMDFKINKELAKPKVHFSEEITVEFFQNEIFNFWKFKPEVILNAYNPLTNIIFLNTGSALYRLPRTALDSLAHEFTHFFQFLKSGKDLQLMILDDDQNEAEAIKIQEWYRNSNPCGVRIEL